MFFLLSIRLFWSLLMIKQLVLTYFCNVFDAQINYFAIENYFWFYKFALQVHFFLKVSNLFFWNYYVLTKKHTSFLSVQKGHAITKNLYFVPVPVRFKCCYWPKSIVFPAAMRVICCESTVKTNQ